MKRKLVPIGEIYYNVIDKKVYLLFFQYMGKLFVFPNPKLSIRKIKYF